MSQIQQAMARLRLLLASTQDREQQVQATIRQFRAQLDRLPQQVIYARTTLEGALAAMAEVEERLADAESVQRRLERIRARVQRELETLQLLQRVDEARERLCALKKRVQDARQADEETLEEIARLEEFIVEHSQRAGRAITEGR